MSVTATARLYTALHSIYTVAHGDGQTTTASEAGSIWVATQDLPRSAGHPFYPRLNQVLDRVDFDGYVETLCQPFYAGEIGRPGLPPERYFRMLLLGYFEGLDSERAIAWRAADSLRVRSFLGLELQEAPPDHSTVSRTRVGSSTWKRIRRFSRGFCSVWRTRAWSRVKR